MPREEQLKNFTIVDNFSPGFRDKRDVTKEAPGVAVSGSQNMITIDGEKIGVRPGYSYLGASSTVRTGIEGGANWKNSTGGEIPWRSYDDELEYYDGSAWEKLEDGFTSAKFRATTWWSSTEAEDLLILVNGDSNLYAWSGGITTYASATANTITKQGTTTWAETRFLTAGTRTIWMKDDGGTWREFTYTGGEGTTTLTGVTPDPTSLSFTAGAKAHQGLVTTSNQPSATKSNDFLATYLNYLFVFDEENRVVEMSKNTDYTDFSAPTSPRLPGEAASFTLDEVPTNAVTQPDGDALYISTKNQWYQFVFTASADLTKEEITILPLKTSALEGATNSLAIGNAKNNIIYVSGEPTIDTLGRVENIDTPQSVPLSDPIKNYMDVSGVTAGSVFYYKNNVYIALREESADTTNNRILIRNLELGTWETPWLISATNFFEYQGNLYFHSPTNPNTFKLFSGYSDASTSTTDGAPTIGKWFSSHEDYGLPFNQKTFDTFWIDGYIRANTKLKVIFSYDFGSEQKTYEIVGTNDDVVASIPGGGLGTYSLGTRSLGGRGETLSASGLKRFRGFIPIPERPFYELEVSFQSSGVEYRFEVVEYGMNIRKVKGTNNNIKIT